MNWRNRADGKAEKAEGKWDEIDDCRELDRESQEMSRDIEDGIAGCRREWRKLEFA
jgi:hypothetical protein